MGLTGAPGNSGLCSSLVLFLRHAWDHLSVQQDFSVLHLYPFWPRVLFTWNFGVQVPGWQRWRFIRREVRRIQWVTLIIFNKAFAFVRNQETVSVDVEFVSRQDSGKTEQRSTWIFCWYSYPVAILQSGKGGDFNQSSCNLGFSPFVVLRSALLLQCFPKQITHAVLEIKTKFVRVSDWTSEQRNHSQNLNK